MVVTLSGWEGNRRSGITLIAMRRRHQLFLLIYGVHGTITLLVPHMHTGNKTVLHYYYIFIRQPYPHHVSTVVFPLCTSR